MSGSGIPHVDHLAVDLKTYFEKTKHLFMHWFDLIKKFFPEVKNGQLTKLLEYYGALHPEEHHFKDFLEECIQYHDFMKHGRDAVMHPRPDQKLEIRDFTLEPARDIQILNPSFRLISPHVKDQEFYDVLDFITNSTLHLIEYTEYLIAFLACYSPMARHGGNRHGLCLLPPDRQCNNVRLSYSMILNGQPIIVG